MTKKQKSARGRHQAGVPRSHAAKTNHVAEPASCLPVPSSPQEACRWAVDAIVGAFPAIMQAQIDKAGEGSHQHAKFLCEFAGLPGALLSPAAAQEDSLARLLLDKLQIGSEDSEASSGEPSSVP